MKNNKMEHTIIAGEYLSLIAKKYSISLGQLLSANPRYKANPDSIKEGDKLAIPITAIRKKTKKKSTNNRATRRLAATDYFKVPAGQLTFDAEGLETPGKYFSRKPHVPGAWSGVTIGRGYDMKERSKDEIIDDLNAAGAPLVKAKKLSRCRGLKGARARNFLTENNLTDLTITPEQQWQLFNSTYEELEGDVIRICSKTDVAAKYGETDWDQLHFLIRDITIDLRYRGDYTGATRERVQPILVINDLDALASLMADRNYWVGSLNVPNDRFKRRRDYLTIES